MRQNQQGQLTVDVFGDATDLITSLKQGKKALEDFAKDALKQGKAVGQGFGAGVNRIGRNMEAVARSVYDADARIRKSLADTTSAMERELSRQTRMRADASFKARARSAVDADAQAKMNDRMLANEREFEANKRALQEKAVAERERVRQRGEAAMAVAARESRIEAVRAEAKYQAELRAVTAEGLDSIKVLTARYRTEQLAEELSYARDLAGIQAREAATAEAEAKKANRAGPRGPSHYDVRGAGDSLMMAGAGVAAPLVGAFMANNAFTQDITQATSNTNLNPDQLAEFTQHVKDLMAISPKPLKEIADGLMYVSDQGYKGADALSIMKVANMQATATGADLTKTAKVLTTVMHQFNIPVGDASRALNLLDSIAAQNQTTFADFIDKAGRGFAAGSAMQQGLLQTAAIMATLTRNGHSAAEGSTALRNIIKDIVSPSSKAQNAIANLSKTTGVDLKEAFSAAGLKSFGVLGIFERVLKATHGNADQMKYLFNNMRSGIATLSLMTLRSKDLQESLDAGRRGEEQNTRIQNNYGRAMKNSASQMGVFRNKVELLGVAFGEKLGPAFDEIIKIGNGVLRVLSGMSDDQKRLLIDAGALSAGLLLVAGAGLRIFDAFRQIGSVAAGVGRFFGNLAGDAGKAATALDGVTTAEKAAATGGVRAFAVGGAWMLAIAAAAVAVYKVKQAWDDARESQSTYERSLTDSNDSGANRTEAGALRKDADKIQAQIDSRIATQRMLHLPTERGDLFHLGDAFQDQLKSLYDKKDYDLKRAKQLDSRALFGDTASELAGVSKDGPSYVTAMAKDSGRMIGLECGEAITKYLNASGIRGTATSLDTPGNQARPDANGNYPEGTIFRPGRGRITGKGPYRNGHYEILHYGPFGPVTVESNYKAHDTVSSSRPFDTAREVRESTWGGRVHAYLPPGVDANYPGAASAGWMNGSGLGGSTATGPDISKKGRTRAPWTKVPLPAFADDSGGRGLSGLALALAHINNEEAKLFAGMERWMVKGDAQWRKLLGLQAELTENSKRLAAANKAIADTGTATAKATRTQAEASHSEAAAKAKVIAANRALNAAGRGGTKDQIASARGTYEQALRDLEKYERSLRAARAEVERLNAEHAQAKDAARQFSESLNAERAAADALAKSIRKSEDAAAAAAFKKQFGGLLKRAPGAGLADSMKGIASWAKGQYSYHRAETGYDNFLSGAATGRQALEVQARYYKMDRDAFDKALDEKQQATEAELAKAEADRTKAGVSAAARLRNELVQEGSLRAQMHAKWERDDERQAKSLGAALKAGIDHVKNGLASGLANLFVEGKGSVSDIIKNLLKDVAQSLLENVIGGLLDKLNTHKTDADKKQDAAAKEAAAALLQNAAADKQLKAAQMMGGAGGAGLMPGLSLAGGGGSGGGGGILGTITGLFGGALGKYAPYLGLAAPLLSVLGHVFPHSYNVPSAPGNISTGLMTGRDYSGVVDSGYSGQDGLRALTGQNSGTAGMTINVAAGAVVAHGVQDGAQLGQQFVAHLTGQIARQVALRNAGTGTV